MRWIGLAFTVLVAWWIARTARKELALVRAEMAADSPLHGFEVHVNDANAQDAQAADVQPPKGSLDVEP